MVKNKQLTLLILTLILLFAGNVIYVWHYQSVPQAGISLLNNVPLPTSSDNILIFSPHPDDETIAVGGYIKAATQVGAKVWIVLVTDGNKHHLEKIRYNEFAKATELLGVPNENLFYLNYPDGKMQKENQAMVADTFKVIITKVQPNKIFIPDFNDRHLDHKFTGLDVDKALSDMKINPQRYYYLVHFPRFPLPGGLKKNLYVLPPIRLLSISKEWLTFPLTVDLENTKLKSVLEYKSQLIFPPLKELLEGLIRRNELFVVEK